MDNDNEIDVNLIELQLAILGSLSLEGQTKQTAKKTVSLQQVLEFIEQHFEIVSSPINNLNILTLLKHVLQMNSSSTETSFEIGNYFRRMVCNHTKEPHLLFILQMLQEILKSLEGKETKSSYVKKDTFDVLTELLFSHQSVNLNPQILECLKQYLRKDHSDDLVEELWTTFKRTKLDQAVMLRAAHILVYLFDEFVANIINFHQDQHLFAVVRNLVLSKVSSERKWGYILLKKFTKVVVERAHNVSCWEFDNTDLLSRNWGLFISIMELTEDSPTHIILRSLHSLYELNSQSNLGKFWRQWMGVLYRRLLNHNDILVVRWILEYLLKSFKCADLDSDVLMQFVEAANHTALYNIEEYCLPKEDIGNFMQCDCDSLLEAFGLVDWECVPLHYWMTQLKLHLRPKTNVTKELLLRLTARMSSLTNLSVRIRIIRLVEDIFYPVIDDMEMVVFIAFVEELYSAGDSYENWLVFADKIRSWSGLNDAVNFSQQFYEIISNYKNHDEVIEKTTAAVFAGLANVPKEKHGWLRFFVVFDLADTKEKKEFCRRIYEVDIEAMNKSSLNEITHEMQAKLMWDEGQESFLRRKCTDFFVCRRLKKFCDISNFALSAQELLQFGSERTLLKVSELLSSHDGEVELVVFDHFLLALLRFSNDEPLCRKVVSWILNHWRNTRSTEAAQQFVNKFLKFDLGCFVSCWSEWHASITFSNECYLKGILSGDAKTEDERMEQAYELKLSETSATQYCNRFSALFHMGPESGKHCFDQLLQLNEDLSKQQPHYSQNCKVHRLKMRIAFAILFLSNEHVSPCSSCDKFWKIVLHQHNQPNIAYAYEWLIGTHASWGEISAQLSKIFTYTPSQQVSVVCITQSWCVRRFGKIDSSKLDHIINHLHRLTIVCTDTEARLYAHLALYNILRHWESAPNMPHWYGQLKGNLAAAMGTGISELMKDIRLNTYKTYVNGVFIWNIICYITNAPCDEYNYELVLKGRMHDFIESRNVFEKNHTLQTEGVGKLLTDNVPTKMTTENYQTKELLVVASLIDDKSNMDVIARGCQDFGVRCLIVNSKLREKLFAVRQFMWPYGHSRHPNLGFICSRTAQHSLDITEVEATDLVEFFIRKQSKGFRIVAVEETATSVDFEEFECPKKCIFLLGHEEKGIPATLTPFLEHSLKVPQVGSLTPFEIAALRLSRNSEQPMMNL